MIYSHLINCIENYTRKSSTYLINLLGITLITLLTPAIHQQHQQLHHQHQQQQLILYKKTAAAATPEAATQEKKLVGTH